MLKQFILFFIGLGIYHQSLAQVVPVLSPHNGNGILKTHYEYQRAHPNLHKKLGIKDTLTIPFFDDFSTSSVWPHDTLWTDNKVFVNTDFALNPPTIGVATFDALDEKGNPYVGIRPNLFGACDTLTSQVFNFTTFSSGSDIYLSFKYQEQGLSYETLRNSDSLIVQFLDSSKKWITVWRATGQGNTQFKNAIIPVDSFYYFHDGFQFRFINYQEYLGAIGQWHVDYIYLERSRNAGDTLFKDVAITEKPESFLKNYQTIPFEHYKTAPIAQHQTPSKISIGNLDVVDRLVNLLDREVYDNNQYLMGTANRSGLNVIGLNDTAFDFSTGFSSSPVLTGDTGVFTIKEYIGFSGANFTRTNDTVLRKIEMANYYAYDDGTAETGFSLRGGGGSIAYGFNTVKEDTLRAISVFYTQAEDSVKRTFDLAVWNSIDLSNGSSELLKRITVFAPVYTDSINKYRVYELDTPILVGEKFYIGWMQTTDFLLNIGYDRNYKGTANDGINTELYFNTFGSWLTNTIPGALMMRPHLGEKIENPASVNKTFFKENYTIYPNPTRDKIFIKGENIRKTIIFDALGKLIIQHTNTNEIDVNALNPGLYILNIENQNGQTQKIKFIKE